MVAEGGQIGFFRRFFFSSSGGFFFRFLTGEFGFFGSAAGFEFFAEALLTGFFFGAVGGFLGDVFAFLGFHRFIDEDAFDFVFAHLLAEGADFGFDFLLAWEFDVFDPHRLGIGELVVDEAAVVEGFALQGENDLRVEDAGFFFVLDADFLHLGFGRVEGADLSGQKGVEILEALVVETAIGLVDVVGNAEFGITVDEPPQGIAFLVMRLFEDHVGLVDGVGDRLGFVHQLHEGRMHVIADPAAEADQTFEDVLVLFRFAFVFAGGVGMDAGLDDVGQAIDVGVAREGEEVAIEGLAVALDVLVTFLDEQSGFLDQGHQKAVFVGLEIIFGFGGQ